MIRTLMGGGAGSVDIRSFRLERAPSSYSWYSVGPPCRIVRILFCTLISIRISPFCELARWISNAKASRIGNVSMRRTQSSLTWSFQWEPQLPVVFGARPPWTSKFLIEIERSIARGTKEFFPRSPSQRSMLGPFFIGSLLNELAISVLAVRYANMLPNRASHECTDDSGVCLGGSWCS